MILWSKVWCKHIVQALSFSLLEKFTKKLRACINFSCCSKNHKNSRKKHKISWCFGKLPLISATCWSTLFAYTAVVLWQFGLSLNTPHTLIATVLHIRQIKKECFMNTGQLIHFFLYKCLVKYFLTLFLLLRMLHFNNKFGNIADNKLLKRLEKRFKNVFNPSKNLCIDESLVLWKGSLSFRQYILFKRHKFGIKMFDLCECKTDYILDFIFYTGSHITTVIDKNLRMTGSVVLYWKQIWTEVMNFMSIAVVKHV